MAWSSIASTTGRLCAIAALTAAVACGDDNTMATGESGATTGVDLSTTGTTARETTEGTTDANETGTASWTGTTTTTGPDPTTGTTTDVTTGEDRDLGMICASLLSRNVEAVQDLCQCDVEAGVWSDLKACMDYNGVDAAAVECECSVYVDYPDLEPSFDCLDLAVAAYLECVAPHDCSAVVAREACLSDYTMAGDLCPSMHDNAAAGEVEILCHGAPAFMCMDGGQVPEAWTCDLEPDCGDGSDESGCPVFQCGDGEEIPDFWQCDGMEDCMDASDEDGCPEFMCMSGESIPESWHCDGFTDCADSSDEVDCPEFMCGSGEAIPESWKCDGEPDCMDDSDEMMCP